LNEYDLTNCDAYAEKGKAIMRKLTKVLFEIAAILFVGALFVFLIGGLGEYYFDKVLRMNISAASAGIAAIMLIAAIISALTSFAVMIKGEKPGGRRHRPLSH
jgi:hypothetical protein